MVTNDCLSISDEKRIKTRTKKNPGGKIEGFSRHFPDVTIRHIPDMALVLQSVGEIL